LEAGTKVFGNNYSAVASSYPKFRARSGAIESMSKRINDCFERSLNGAALDTNSKEMLAIKAYMNWLGKGLVKGIKPLGSGFKDLAFLERAADPELGKAVYIDKCQSCHQATGSGLMNGDKTAYTYPPLWGDHSYNNGAGLYRLSNFAKYVKYNMPLGVSHTSTQLSDEEAWDVAAFVNSQVRPMKDTKKDWPKIEAKPFDHPFGPYADGFDEKQHKYGPFKPIKEKLDAMKKEKKGKV
jgi:thiosulfate dehydrogenase